MSSVFDDMDGIAPSDIAERWYARLMASDCSVTEREKFELWLSQSPENALAFEEAKALWASLEGLDEDEVLAPHAAAALDSDAEPFMGQWASAVDGLKRRPQPVRRRNWLPWGARMAAAALLTAVLLPIRSPDTAGVTYAATSKVESVALADGSAVQLDLDTALAVTLTDSRRQIELSQGRAVFDVAKDVHRPFVVDAGVGTITALGTEFQVQKVGERVSVTLLEGAVGIDTNARGGVSQSLRLIPGQQASYAPETGSWSVELVDPASQVSWSKGFHVFAATPLREAIAEINRYSPIDLTLADSSAGQLLVSGSFKLGDGRAVAEALPYALPVKVSERGGSLVISKR